LLDVDFDAGEVVVVVGTVVVLVWAGWVEDVVGGGSVVVVAGSVVVVTGGAVVVVGASVVVVVGPDWDTAVAPAGAATATGERTTAMTITAPATAEAAGDRAPRARPAPVTGRPGRSPG
jgi:hypothetical protein